MLGGFSRWYMRRMPPDFGCCANAGVAASAKAATAKPMSLVFILSLPVTRFGSPAAPLLLLDGHANRCGGRGQPGRRIEGCGLNSPGTPEWQRFAWTACQPAAFPPTMRLTGTPNRKRRE